MEHDLKCVRSVLDAVAVVDPIAAKEKSLAKLFTKLS